MYKKHSRDNHLSGPLSFSCTKSLRISEPLNKVLLSYWQAETGKLKELTCPGRRRGQIPRSRMSRVPCAPDTDPRSLSSARPQGRTGPTHILSSPAKTPASLQSTTRRIIIIIVKKTHTQDHSFYV